MYIFSYFLIFTTSCIERQLDNSCDDFIAYICTCHPKNPKYNCIELQNIYRDADLEKQEQCTLQLDDQIYEDTKNNLQCTLETQIQSQSIKSTNKK